MNKSSNVISSHQPTITMIYDMLIQYIKQEYSTESNGLAMHKQSGRLYFFLTHIL